MSQTYSLAYHVSTMRIVNHLVFLGVPVVWSFAAAESSAVVDAGHLVAGNIGSVSSKLSLLHWLWVHNSFMVGLNIGITQTSGCSASIFRCLWMLVMRSGMVLYCLRHTSGFVGRGFIFEEIVDVILQSGILTDDVVE